MTFDGTYQVKTKSMLGSASGEIVLKAVGGKLTGVVDAMGMHADIKDVKVDGNSFVCTVEGDGPVGHMVLDVKGVVEGDNISGSIKFGRVKATFEGSRI